MGFAQGLDAWVEAGLKRRARLERGLGKQLAGGVWLLAMGGGICGTFIPLLFPGGLNAYPLQLLFPLGIILSGIVLWRVRKRLLASLGPEKGERRADWLYWLVAMAFAVIGINTARYWITMPNPEPIPLEELEAGAIAVDLMPPEPR